MKRKHGENVYFQVYGESTFIKNILYNLNLHCGHNVRKEVHFGIQFIYKYICIDRHIAETANVDYRVYSLPTKEIKLP
jgi:hypothetical protein